MSAGPAPDADTTGELEAIAAGEAGAALFEDTSRVRRLVRIALPLTTSGAVRYVVELLNAFWLGRVGVLGLSVVAGLGYFLWLSRMFAGLTTAGTSAVVGRALGEGRERAAKRLARRALAFSHVMGVVVALLGLLVSPLALDALGFDGADRAPARGYLLVVLAGLPVSFSLMTLNAALVGLGHPKASLRASSASFFTAAALNPVLVLVFHLGVPGAAVAEVAGEIAGLTVALRAFRAVTADTPMPSFRQSLREPRKMMPIVRVGGPLTLDSVVHGVVGFLLVSFLSRYGDAFVAAQGTEERLTQLLNLPTEGLAPAAATLVGWHVGRSELVEVKRVVAVALSGVLCCAFVGAVLLFRAPPSLIALLCDDPTFVAVGARVFAAAAIGLVFLGARDVLEAAWSGLGRPWPPVAIGLGAVLLRFPLAVHLAVGRNLGGVGVAWAVNGTLALQALVLGVWFFLRKVSVAPSLVEPEEPR